MERARSGLTPVAERPYNAVVLRSMTGFGAGSATVDGEQLSVEIRAVNQKFIDVKLRLPRELAALEVEAVHAVKARLARGMIDIQVHRRALNGATSVSIDLALAREYAQAFDVLARALQLEERPSAKMLFGADGVVRLEERAASLEGSRAALHGALTVALDQLIEMREREGEALARDLISRLATLRQLAAAILAEVPAALDEHRRKLSARVGELLASPLDPGRLEQELALIADRTDIAEELTRFDSHLEQLGTLLAGDAPAGRRLDFLAQELHREVTTMGNKSQNVTIARLVIDLKTETERVREQVQNVE